MDYLAEGVRWGKQNNFVPRWLAEFPFGRNHRLQISDCNDNVSLRRNNSPHCSKVASRVSGNHALFFAFSMRRVSCTAAVNEETTMHHNTVPLSKFLELLRLSLLALLAGIHELALLVAEGLGS